MTAYDTEALTAERERLWARVAEIDSLLLREEAVFAAEMLPGLLARVAEIDNLLAATP